MWSYCGGLYVIFRTKTLVGEYRHIRTAFFRINEAVVLDSVDGVTLKQCNATNGEELLEFLAKFVPALVNEDYKHPQYIIKSFENFDDVDKISLIMSGVEEYEYKSFHKRVVLFNRYPERKELSFSRARKQFVVGLLGEKENSYKQYDNEPFEDIPEGKIVYNGLMYNTRKFIAQISKYKGEDPDVVLPALVEDYDVLFIKSGAFKDNQIMKNVTISDGIMVIERRAFMNCSNLTNVVIPDTVEDIEDKAFYDCPNLDLASIDKFVKLFPKAFGESKKK